MKSKKKLKLFIYTGFCPDYTDGLAFAIASDVKESKEMIEKYLGYEVCQWGDLEIRNLDKKVAVAVYGGS